MTKKKSPLSKGAKRRQKKGLPLVVARNPDVAAMRQRPSGAHTDKKKQNRKQACRSKPKLDE